MKLQKEENAAYFLPQSLHIGTQLQFQLESVYKNSTGIALMNETNRAEPGQDVRQTKRKEYDPTCQKKEAEYPN